jgi:peptidoglycan/xylan/chitin deacetylase (PgdA/CDA1 family)
LQKNNLSATFFIATGYLNGGIMWNDQVIEAIRRQELDTLDLTHYGLHCFDISTPEKKSAVAQQVLQKIKHLPTQKRQTIADYIADQVKTIPSHLMMTDEQLIKLHQAGMEIGGHTVTHPILVNLDDQKATQEIVQNKQTLEQLLQQKIRLFAYPNGKPDTDYRVEQIKLLKAAGYQAAVSTQWGVANKNSDFFQLPRFTPWDQDAVKFMGRMIMKTYK